ncbi:MAG: putative CRISPR-associated protein [Leptolyngbyaceae cyanobacterium HOT.MB2.61]|nr:putative CRISPR-associated protein [Leptolyngbyaceae cyanobacterium HOT.MB2.61]
MKTIIMTVGTSLLTNPDKDIENKRPWIGQKSIGNFNRAIQWMSQTDLALISAETNTLNRLSLQLDDEIILLHSDTPSGLECAEVLKEFFQRELGQKTVYLHKLPGLNYESEESASALEQMANLLKTLIAQAQGEVTLAATGGFKAQTMVMALIGNALGIPVCYIHEEFKGLVYLPYILPDGKAEKKIRTANLPASGVPREKVLQVRSDQQEPNRPRHWQKVKKMLQEIPWIERVYYDERAYSAPENGVKESRQKTDDGRYVLWMRLVEKDKPMAVAIETTGRSQEHLRQAIDELTERLGRLL